MRAVVDIGSNSVLLLVAERPADRCVKVRQDLATVARLSEGAAARGTLCATAIERTLLVLRRYAEIARAEGIETIDEAVATEGVRMASNADDFLSPAARILGRPVRLISGEEEARLSYRSVALELPQGAQDPLRVIDIGGASTEIAVGRGLELEQARSHRVGSVRLSERFGDGHPPSPSALAAMAGAAREAFEAQALPPQPLLVGLAGTVTTVAGLLLGLDRYERERVDGSRFGIAELRQLCATLGRETLEQLRARPLVGRGRADVIMAGLTILISAMEHCGAETLLVRDRGLRYALI